MDASGNLNLRNWGFLETPSATLKNTLNLQLIPEKPLFCPVDDHLHPNPPPVMAPTNNGLEYLNLFSANLFPANHYNSYHHQPSFGISPETSSARSLPIPHPINLPKNDKNAPEQRESGKGPTAKKKQKKARTKAPLAHRAKAPKKRAEIEINGLHLDISDIPIPVCSCTGTPQQCYRWGSGGWQSACCTTGLSLYPLPMNTKRRGARIAGRKMSIGAFKKVLEKLTGEGYDFSNPIDLRSYWAKHGTNKFVTIR
ncbi:GAGA-binding protein [Striga asiatica]|uniref:GAGA-binding transcriptional activator n=1 Tax=Striga asiatica TaxID=4170 RepID=A0A5A7RCU1_STRAF|nr:GAGA-binding protein [Striga asiatica]